jgi:hypothetical protein
MPLGFEQDVGSGAEHYETAIKLVFSCSYDETRSDTLRDVRCWGYREYNPEASLQEAQCSWIFYGKRAPRSVGG